MLLQYLNARIRFFIVPPCLYLGIMYYLCSRFRKNTGLYLMLLSIIIIEYHSRQDVRRCIDSLLGRLAVPYEIIVSSNSCYTPEERHGLTAEGRGVRWLFNERNGGFAYAMNCGLREAKGDLLVIMNPDCLLRTDLAAMSGFMQEHPEVGAIAPRMCDEDDELQDTAREYVTLPRLAMRFLRRVMRRSVCVYDNMDYSKVQTVDWVIGSFIMVSRKAYEATGGLDDRYFMYAEDLDWCTRIRKAGLEVVYYPKECITYKGTRRARGNMRYAMIFFKSHILYWSKFGFFSGHPKRKPVTYA